jgi:hypothetical protein
MGFIIVSEIDLCLPQHAVCWLPELGMNAEDLPAWSTKHDWLANTMLNNSDKFNDELQQ